VREVAFGIVGVTHLVAKRVPAEHDAVERVELAADPARAEWARSLLGARGVVDQAQLEGQLGRGPPRKTRTSSTAGTSSTPRGCATTATCSRWRSRPFDVYGGVGLGVMDYDAEVDLGPISASADGFLFAADVFAGATITLRNELSLGLEAKYYVTEEISEFDNSLDAFALMLTVGFGR
jgi:hypothetical protein